MRSGQASKDQSTTGLTLRQATIVFLILAILTANAVSICFALGVFTLWEAALALITVLTLAAGTIWTIVNITQKTLHRANFECEPSDSSD